MEEQKKDKKNKLIFSMLLNIQEGINEVIQDFNVANPDWENILENLNEKEAELVFVLKNAQAEIQKKIC